MKPNVFLYYFYHRDLLHTSFILGKLLLEKTSNLDIV